jgi:hypothetical protein
MIVYGVTEWRLQLQRNLSKTSPDSVPYGQLRVCILLSCGFTLRHNHTRPETTIRQICRRGPFANPHSYPYADGFEFPNGLAGCYS